MGRPGRIVIAGFAVTLCTAFSQEEGAERAAAVRRDGAEFTQRIRNPQARRICAVDRLAESRLPRTTCMTEREWRDRQIHGLRKE